MKLFGLMACGLLALSAAAQDQVTWLNRTHDFGAFDEDTKKKTAYFRFVNTTAEPVSVISATATCGCTVPKYDTAPVAPGDTATIEVSYDPSGRPGRFEKQVYVRTSDSYDRTRLIIKGTVIGNPVTINGRYPVTLGPLKLRTDGAMFGRAYSGQGKMAYVDGYNMSQDTIAPALVSGPGWITMQSSPARVAPGEMLTLEMQFHGESCPEWGAVTDSVMVAPNGAAQAVGQATALAPGQAYSLPVIVIVEEDFSGLTDQQRRDAPVAALESDRIDLTPIAPGATKPVTKTLKLKNKGKDPLKIHRVYSQDPGVSVKVNADEVRGGKEAVITLTYDPTVQPSGVINARFTVITNDPISPVQPVRIVAERQ